MMKNKSKIVRICGIRRLQKLQRKKTMFFSQEILPILMDITT